jgi:hypothetical protein
VSLGGFQEDLGHGDRVRGTVAVIPLVSLRGWDGEGSCYWRYALGACVEAAGTQAIVFDSAEGVGD